jgi:hypothetical protein
MKSLDNSFDLSGLFEQQFGYKTQAFNFPKLSAANIVAKRGTDLVDNDAFGREFFMPVWIGKDNNSLIELPYAVIRTESRKYIVDTHLTERTGTVKELVNIDNYKFIVKGLIINKGGQWPEDEINQLNNLYLIKDSLIIKSALTDIFLLTPERGGHDKVAISSFRLLEGKGAIHIRAYEMELISDEEFNLYQVS